MRQFKIALCQILPDNDKAETVAHAYRMVEDAVRQGAYLIVLPEIFYMPYNLSRIPAAMGGETEILDRFCLLAKRHKVMICTGSMAWEHEGRIYNKSHLINADGAVVHSYSKCHLFDVDVDDLHVRESAVFSPGNEIAVAATDIGMVGIEICYDIRFPEFTREMALQGAEIILVPSVFSHITGAAHWHSFMKTRATENQLFLAAVSPARSNAEKGYRAYGHSMVVSPWGEILAEAGEEETIVYTECDPELLAAIRKKLPLLQHRRDTLYTSSRQKWQNNPL